MGKWYNSNKSLHGSNQWTWEDTGRGTCYTSERRKPGYSGYHSDSRYYSDYRKCSWDSSSSSYSTRHCNWQTDNSDDLDGVSSCGSIGRVSNESTWWMVNTRKYKGGTCPKNMSSTSQLEVQRKHNNSQRAKRNTNEKANRTSISPKLADLLSQLPSVSNNSQDDKKSAVGECDQKDEYGWKKFDEQWAGYTGPQAKDKDTYEHASEWNSNMPTDEKLKLPKMLYTDEEKNQISSLPQFSGARQPPTWTQACDFCGGVTWFAAAFIQCTDTGEIPVNHNTPKLDLAHLFLESEGEGCQDHQVERKCKHKSALEENLMNCCYKCYGERFQNDEKYYVSDDGRNFKSRWYNLRRSTKKLDQKEEEWVAYLFSQALEKVPKEDQAKQMRFAEAFENIMKNTTC